MGAEVPMTTTRLPLGEVRALLSELLAGPGLVGLPFAMAQIRLETDNGRASQNWNVGNISQWKDAPSDYWVPPWVRDTSHRLHQKWKQGKVPGAFRAYPSLRAGVTDYVERLRHDFPEILQAWLTGDPDQVWRAIRRRYMPDDLGDKAAAALDNWRKLVAEERGGGASPKAQPPVQPPGEPSSFSDWPSGFSVPRTCSAGAPVRLVQRFLRLPVTGVWGANDGAVLMAWQYSWKLTMDGWFGPKCAARAQEIQREELKL